jgi:hypothetical protein
MHLEGTWPSIPNAEGDVTGEDYDGVNVGFVRDASGTLTTIDVTGGKGMTFPVWINDFGAITGSFYNPDVAQGFVRLTHGPHKGHTD